MTEFTPEEHAATISALVLLCNLGWTFLPPEQALAARGGKLNEVVLRDELRAQLGKRRFRHAGREYSLDHKAQDSIIGEICRPVLNEGLRAANERLYNHLLYGISVTQFVDGKKASPTISLIDWQNPRNNSFLLAEEFPVQRAGRASTRRPNIVCFVNGIPLAMIEAKRPDGHEAPTVDEGIRQFERNQRPDEIPQLFAYSQLLLAIDGVAGRYGTCQTRAKFWAAWDEQEFSEAAMATLKHQPLSATRKDLLFRHRSASDRLRYNKAVSGNPSTLTGQDKLLIGLLSPQRLLEMTRYYILFDRKAGKIVARYPQVFGITRLLGRIEQRDAGGARRGGVVWHTTGSGKSFTMVFFAKLMALHEDLQRCSLVVVTDRVDLEHQLSGTFASGGALETGKDFGEALIKSGTKLAEAIGRGRQRIIFSLIQKFNTAIELPECRNDSSDIVVLIDEGHRSQGGVNHAHMRRVLPNACFVAFTGTPLLKDEKTTNQFGPIVHTYTMQRAVQDKAVTPLLYEERRAELAVDDRVMDHWFARITKDLSEDQQARIKKKLVRQREVCRADDRIRLIAMDIAHHLDRNLGEGLKAQLACESKEAAVRYKKYLDEEGLFESAVVMSEPDRRKGDRDRNLSEVSRWWAENVGARDESDYTKSVVERFDKDPDLKLLIVVDKLLTGFDEPKNAVLYIDKPLRQHNLIQAIARVNRLCPGKDYGWLIDYRGILSELDTALAGYRDLASRTRGGYDVADIAGLYRTMSSEYKRLPRLHEKLWAVFAAVRNKHDTEALRQALVPRMEERNGCLVDIHLKIREDFYEALNEFSRCLAVALQSADYCGGNNDEDSSFTEEDRQNYKETLKQMNSLRQIACRDAGDIVIMDDYTQRLQKLIDKHLVGVAVNDPGGSYDVNKLGDLSKSGQVSEPGSEPEDWSADKTRNETDLIKTRIAKIIDQQLRDDPYARESFSLLLRQKIHEAGRLFEHPLKQYLLFKEFEEQVQERKLPDMPAALAGNRRAQACFGVFKKTLPETFAQLDADGEAPWIELAFTADSLVRDAVAENSINPQNMEAEIRKKLLPLMFKRCKAEGQGMARAKAIVDLIVQITRLGLDEA